MTYIHLVAIMNKKKYIFNKKSKHRKMQTRKKKKKKFQKIKLHLLSNTKTKQTQNYWIDTSGFLHVKLKNPNVDRMPEVGEVMTFSFEIDLENSVY